jgi:hypothetical protein
MKITVGIMTPNGETYLSQEEEFEDLSPTATKAQFSECIEDGDLTITSPGGVKITIPHDIVKRSSITLIRVD